ncbi:MAG: type III-B CRISPR-associated protein Cas10/Cmr2 [Thermodesulfobacteriota bacterium]
MTTQTMWQTKVLCWVRQDMAAFQTLRGRIEKAMRDCPDKPTMDKTLERAIQWAQAADRVPVPQSISLSAESRPEIVHPLTGEAIPFDRILCPSANVLQTTPEAASDAASATSLSEPPPARPDSQKDKPTLESLIVETSTEIDWENTFLRIWRFAPDVLQKGFGSLWRQYPTDMRSPDHTVWESLTLTSAMAGAMAADPNGLPALLLMSFGPVQGFIAQARSVSDLWAGSHFISRIAWEAAQIICNRYGPDAMLFPNLHGVPHADFWLYRKLGQDWPKSHTVSWMEETTDANPLFIATLPNRFVAIVPAQDAKTVVEKIETHLHDWVTIQAKNAFLEILGAAGKSSLGKAAEQMEAQLKDFPEIHWAIVPWRLATKDGTTLNDDSLQSLISFLGETSHPGEEVFREPISIHEEQFYCPNPGIAYPHLFEALERLTAAAKSCRTFSGNRSEGYRCTLCGEWEWLTPDRGDPTKPSGIFAPIGQRGEESPWPKAAQRAPSLVREKEFLCARCTLKRVWPRLVVQEAVMSIPKLDDVHRYIVSTHAMAVSTSIRHHLHRESEEAAGQPDEVMQQLQRKAVSLCALQQRISSSPELKGSALPASLYRKLKVANRNPQDVEFYRKLPSLLDTLETDQDRDAVVAYLVDLLGVKPETYYALILMDGDRMGAWLAGEMHAGALETRFHSTLRQSLAGIAALDAYRSARRPVSPGYHQAVSTALNSFALYLARTVVEEMFMGKLIFAGGEDILAMVAVHDLPAVMTTLRCAFSGVLPAGVDQQTFWSALNTEADRLELSSGFVIRREGDRKDILRLMGKYATASMGAVIAHHQAPLGRVIGALYAAESQAKNDGGRDAFCITVMKRSGGTHHFIGKWGLDTPWSESDMGLLFDLRKSFARDISRRTAYILEDILPKLPASPGALSGVLRYQFSRQSKGPDAEIGDLPERLEAAARKRDGTDTTGRAGHEWLHTLILTAEFLAREGRWIETEG